jgi:hypothetical protein
VQSASIVRHALESKNVDERARRIGQNEALFREINERIEGMNAAFGAVTDTMSVVCECGDASCAQQIEIEMALYEHVRANPTHFLVVPGHEITDVEEVVEEHPTFSVVRKQAGGAAELARETDPRS